jgi:pyridoxamine 5'-phosphate oxidase
MKGYGPDGFVFYTDYGSRKAREMTDNPQVSALFWWEPLERQVRIEGRVVRTSDSESDAYYHSRPLGSRLGAWASPQSEVIANRAILETRVQEMRTHHGEQPPRPPGWGGFRLIPSAFEFWQGRADRLHDRICYHLDSERGWTRFRLAP